MQQYKFTCGPYTITVADSLPPTYYSYSQRAQLVETFELDGVSSLCYLSVARGHAWPFLIVAQRYHPGASSGFFPGVLFVPENETLLLAAGERLLAYELTEPRRLLEYHLPGGFWQWERTQDRIILASENELSVWDTSIHKHWDFPLDPPWQYSLNEGIIHVSMGDRQTTLHSEDGIIVESVPPLEALDEPAEG